MLYVFCLLITIVQPLSRTSINGQCNLHFTVLNNTSTFTSCSLVTASMQEQSLLADWDQCRTLCCNGMLAVTAQQPEYCCLTLDPKINKIKQTLKMLLLLVVIALLICGAWMARKAYKRLQQRDKEIAGLNDSDLTKSIYKIVWLNHDAPEKLQSSCEGFTKEKQQEVQNIRKYDICFLCNKDKASTYSYCGHSFHAQCVHSWWLDHPKCPKCKYHLARMKMYCSCCLNTYFILQKDYFIKLGPITVLCIPCGAKKEFQDRILKHYWQEGTGKEEGRQVGNKYIQ